MARINVLGLEVSEPELTWSSVVAMRTSEDDRDFLVLEDPHGGW